MFLLAGPGSASAENVPEGLIVVVSPKSKVRNISMRDLRRMYGGQSVSGGGRTLLPINLPASTQVRRKFDKLVLKMSPSEIARYWQDKRIRGGARPPKELYPEKKVLMMAARYPAVVAYLPSSFLRNKLIGKVRVLTVDGKSPSDEDYKLRTAGE